MFARHSSISQVSTRSSCCHSGRNYGSVSADPLNPITSVFHYNRIRTSSGDLLPPNAFTSRTSRSESSRTNGWIWRNAAIHPSIHQPMSRDPLPDVDLWPSALSRRRRPDARRLFHSVRVPSFSQVSESARSGWKFDGWPPLFHVDNSNQVHFSYSMTIPAVSGTALKLPLECGFIGSGAALKLLFRTASGIWLKVSRNCSE